MKYKLLRHDLLEETDTEIMVIDNYHDAVKEVMRLNRQTIKDWQHYSFMYHILPDR